MGGLSIKSAKAEKAEIAADAVLPILKSGNPLLRRRARRLGGPEMRTQAIRDLILRMRETMRAAPGVGLAAPQIGENLALFVVEDRREYMQHLPPAELLERERKPVPFQVFANPVITPLGEDRRAFFEGCLSLPGFTAVVYRPRQIRINYLDAEGREQEMEAAGWPARILQHETDHVDGILYIDRMQSRSFMSLEQYDEHYKGKPLADIQTILGY